MKRYRVDVREIMVSSYIVEAKNKDEAEENFQDGDYRPGDTWEEQEVVRVVRIIK